MSRKLDHGGKILGPINGYKLVKNEVEECMGK